MHTMISGDSFPGGDVFPEDIINAEVSSAGVTQDITEQLAATDPDHEDHETVEAMRKSQILIRATSVVILHKLVGLGDDAATTLATRYSELESENPYAELYEVAAEYELKRLAAANPKEQRAAERTGELARAVAATATPTAVWYVRGPSAIQSLLPVARNFVAKVGDMEGPRQTVDYLNNLLDAIAVEN
jgi:hypothetical protein